MWSYSVIRRSTEAQRLKLLAPRLAASFSDPEEARTRRFSSNDSSGYGGGRGQGGRGPGGRGSGGRGPGGRGSGGRINNYKGNFEGNNFMSGKKRGGRGRRPREPGFKEKFFEPAERGELKKHQSGVPKLLGRKTKGRLRGADPEAYRAMNEDDDFNFDDDEFDESDGRMNRIATSNKNGKTKRAQPYKLVEEVVDIHDDAIYYWDESEYDTFIPRKELKLLESQEKDDTDGNVGSEDGDEESDKLTNADGKMASSVGAKVSVESPEDIPIISIIDFLANPPKERPSNPDYDTVAPLKLDGPEMSDLSLAMLKQPTKYAEFRYDDSHPDSRREPRPDIPKNLAQPSLDFLDEYTRFLYVTGLPPVMADGELGDFNNPIHRHEVQKVVARMFNVKSETISPANMTSCYIGFHSPEERKSVLDAGPNPKVCESPVTISKYDPSAVELDTAFAKESPDSIIVLRNLPMGSSSSILARTVFPSKSDVREIYGKSLSQEDIRMISPNSALVRLESAEMVESAITSSMVQQRLVELGQHRIRYSKARRELVFTGKHGGPLGSKPLRDVGPRLIVDGDLPTRNFFLSHAGVVHLRQLDPSITKEDISKFFQPFCTVKRDVEGSVEFVTCHEGLPTGKAYVGFDEIGEAEAVIKAFKGGRITGLCSDVVIMKSVKELYKNKRRVEARSTRSEEELLDNLNNWEQYVDPADVEEILVSGISKDALDEALRSIRYNNPTFASFDQSIRAESSHPDREAGDLYRELVQEYITTLKECIATPENPGEVYESLFFPDEEMEFDFFDVEKKRLDGLKKKREVPSS